MLEFAGLADSKCLHSTKALRCGKKMEQTIVSAPPEVLIVHFGAFGPNANRIGSGAQAIDPSSLGSFVFQKTRYSLVGLLYYLPSHFTGEFLIRVNGLDAFYYYDGLKNGGQAVCSGSSPKVCDPFNANRNLLARVILMFYSRARE